MIVGLKYNDEVYYYMSRGLIDPGMLEQLPTQQMIPSIVMAPSTLFSEAWESPEFKSFYHQIFNNLQEDTEEEKKFTIENKTMKEYYEAFEYEKKPAAYHFKWNVN